MAVFQAFRCIHPAPGLEQEIAALPYDVYSREEALAAVKNCPRSFLRIDRAETQFPSQVDAYDERVYEKARDLLWSMVEQGEFVEEAKPAYYLYELTMNGRSQTGIVGCASIDDYLSGVIKKHENTRAEKERDRIRHVDVCGAQTGPIFLAYRQEERISQIVDTAKEQEPMFSFVSEDGVGHRGWRIEGPQQIWALSEAFWSIPHLYIADGHHRAASAVQVGQLRRQSCPAVTGEEPFHYFLAVAFPDTQLQILDYNRVVRDLNGLSRAEFLERAGESFQIQLLSERRKPDEKGTVTMFLEEQWYLLRAKPEIRTSDPVDGLDVSLLQNYLMGPVLGIGDPRTDRRIDFVGGIRGLEELERRVHTDMKAAFAMYPTSMEELFAVADAGLLMPPKSTWFEPKLRSGLFIHGIGRK
ncbi:MAG: DUF1015 domain-containing protein [Lachnospiraceae bacterium]|jgi:uncharacterized protein (DUF1015 family)|nr:DUF1015 domain-containing protein [Lachnospiraceae bacterium]